MPEPRQNARRRPAGTIVRTAGVLVMLGLAVVPVHSAKAPATSVVFRNAAGEIVGSRDQRGIVRTHIGASSGRWRAAPKVDADLEPGFPVQAVHLPGSYQGGAAIHTLVGNIDRDPQLEIIASALAAGPVYAWNHDGTVVRGWPVLGNGTVGYAALGRLGRTPFPEAPGAIPPQLSLPLEVVIGFFWHIESIPAPIGAYTGNGRFLSGWPRTAVGAVTTPPSLANVVGLGADEVFVGEEDHKLHGYRANAQSLTGWPPASVFGTGQALWTPAVADVDGDGIAEIVTTSSSSAGLHVLAFRPDGTRLPGYPLKVPPSVMSFPAIGDLDGDKINEIVVVSRAAPDTPESKIYVFKLASLEWSATVRSGPIYWGTAPALADLNGDRKPEIVVQSEYGLDVWYGDGRPFSGWPVTWASNYFMGNSAPVVGDIDGDGQPEIVITTYRSGQSEEGELRAYNANGTLVPRFPKILNIGNGGVPAIADFDVDGRNEILVCGSYWNGAIGMFDKCWAYDLKGSNYGKIEWGQFGGNASHTGRYPVPPPP